MSERVLCVLACFMTLILLFPLTAVGGQSLDPQALVSKSLNGEMVWLQNDNDDHVGYFDSYQGGMKVGVVLSPQGWHYPCRVDQIKFRFYRPPDGAPMTVARVELYALSDGRPGALLGQSSNQTYTTGDGWVTVDISAANVILYAPQTFVAAVAYTQGQGEGLISVVNDSSRDIPKNVNFYWMDGVWHEHYSFWYAGRQVGHAMIRALIETQVVDAPTPTQRPPSATFTAIPTNTRPAPATPTSTRPPAATVTDTRTHTPLPPTATMTPPAYPGRNTPTPTGGRLSTVYVPLLLKSASVAPPTPVPPTITATPTYTRPPAATPTATRMPPTVTPTATTGTSAWTPILTENFEGAFPGSWTVFDDNREQGGEYYWAKRDCRAAGGQYSAWAIGGGADGGGLACGSTYPNGVNSWMVTRPFDLSDATDVAVSGALWINTDRPNDVVGVMLSNDGRNFRGMVISYPLDSWVPVNFRVSDMENANDYLGRREVLLGVIFQSDGSTALPGGAHVDNILVQKCTQGTCPDPFGESAASGGAFEAIERVLEAPLR